MLVPEWHQHAACGGKANLMFPAPDDQRGIRTARQICKTCPVLAECDQWSRSFPPGEDPGGVLAGRTSADRL